MKRALVLLAAAALSGCSLKDMALRTTAELLEDGSSAFFEESDTVLARESLGAQLKMVEGLLKNDPANRRLLFLAAQGYSGYAFLFLEDKEPGRAKIFYQRGRDYGSRLLARNKSLSGALGLPLDDLEARLKTARQSDVPGLFWTAYGLSSWVNLSRDSAEAVAELPKAVLLMKRVHELDAAYNFAGTDLFFGVYYASRPKILGGDPEKSKAHFESARRINRGKFLTAHLLEARYYAVAAQDQEHFTNLLKRVADSAAGELPNARLADEVAKEKAKALMEKTDEYF